MVRLPNPHPNLTLTRTLAVTVTNPDPTLTLIRTPRSPPSGHRPMEAARHRAPPVLAGTLPMSPTISLISLISLHFPGP